MRALARVVLGVAVVIAIVVAVGLLLPRGYRVERSIEIAAAQERIFANLEDPRAWVKWTVWNQRDPNMALEYSGAPAGVGAKWAWRSKTEGTGSMEFTRVEAPALIEYRLFFPDFDAASTGQIRLAPAGTGTRVVWSNQGELGSNPLMRYIGLFMDSMMGPDFEAGLKNLKALAEKAE